MWIFIWKATSERNAEAIAYSNRDDAWETL